MSSGLKWIQLGTEYNPIITRAEPMLYGMTEDDPRVLGDAPNVQ